MCIRRVCCVHRMFGQTRACSLRSSSLCASIPCAFAKKKEGDCVGCCAAYAARTARGLHAANWIFIYLRATTSPSRASRIPACSKSMSPVILRFQTRRISCGIIRNRRATTRVRASRKAPSIRRQAELALIRTRHGIALPPVARDRLILRCVHAHTKSVDEVRQCASPVSRAGIERKLASWRIADFLSAFPRDSKSQGISNFAKSASRVLLLSLPFCWRRDRRAVELDL